MTSAKKPKVEVRSKTGQPYRRAGALWSPQWTELDESKFTTDQLKLVAEDPHLDVRVGGKRVTDTDEDDDSTVDSDTERKLASLADSVAELTARNYALEAQVQQLKAELAAKPAGPKNKPATPPGPAPVVSPAAPASDPASPSVPAPPVAATPSPSEPAKA